MNYIKHLTGFFDKVAKERTLNPTHVSMYVALFQFWNCNRFKNPISISRDEVMRISKISSKATYHKCLKNLHTLGYIKYEPSYNPFKGSQVYLFNFSDELKPLSKNEASPKIDPVSSPVTEQVVYKHQTGYETSSEQAIVSYINNTNIPNIPNDLKIVNLGKQAKNVIAKNEAISENEFVKNKEIEKEKSCAKKEKEEIHDFVTPSAVEVSHFEKSKPTIEIVKSYFQSQNFPEIEAQKFFNYFCSIGWLVGGRTPMVDWQAAAQNWIINAPKFISNEQQHNRAKQLNTTTDKDYSEPL